MNTSLQLCLVCVHKLRSSVRRKYARRYHNVRRTRQGNVYLVLDDKVDGDRAQQASYRSDSVRNAHQYAGVPRCDVQMIDVETYGTRNGRLSKQRNF